MKSLFLSFEVVNQVFCIIFCTQTIPSMWNRTLIPKSQSLKALENCFCHFSSYVQPQKSLRRFSDIYYAELDLLNLEYLMNPCLILKSSLWITPSSSFDSKLNGVIALSVLKALELL